MNHGCRRVGVYRTLLHADKTINTDLQQFVFGYKEWRVIIVVNEGFVVSLSLIRRHK